MKTYSKIIGTGSYIPPVIVKNRDFLHHNFYTLEGEAIETSNEEIIQKLYEISNISERRYAPDEMNTSDMATEAAKVAISDAKIDPETIDAVLVGHIFGDVTVERKVKDIMPALATRVKRNLGIKNPYCVAHDVVSGCPGWTQAMILANDYIRGKSAQRVLVVGADAISRVINPKDRDSMLYGDGAGAIILEGVASDNPTGILHSLWRTDADVGHVLFMGEANANQEDDPRRIFIKMQGHPLFKYALAAVPEVVQKVIDESEYEISDIKKIFIHQANEKLDDAILRGLGKIYNIDLPKEMMPMTVGRWGNSGSATIPMLIDEVLKGRMEGQQVNNGDLVIIASVGAGMTINVILYKF